MKKPEALYEIMENLYRLSDRDLKHLNEYIFKKYKLKKFSIQGRENSYLCEYLDLYADEDQRLFVLSFVYEYLKNDKGGRI